MVKLAIPHKFLVLLLSFGVVVACEDASSKNDNWEKLCNITDCEQFPSGYHVKKFGETNYYLPYDDSELNVRNIRDTTNEQLYYQIKNNQLVRSVELDPEYYYIDRCCNRIINKLKLNTDLISNPITLHPSNGYKEFENYINVKYRHLSDNEIEKLSSYDENFRILHRVYDAENNEVSLALISVKKLYFNWRIVLLCRRSTCSVGTYDALPSTNPLLFSTQSFSIHGTADLPRCDGELVDCARLKRYVGYIPQKMNIILQIVSKLQQKPSN